MMKKFTLLFLALVGILLSGCGTVGGALSGAGTDLTSAGNWVKEIGQ
jgi:predicted small secreted protein